MCGCTLEDNSTYIDQSLCYGDDIDLDNDNDGIPNYADVCPNDDGIVGHDWDYGNSDDTGACSGACDREFVNKLKVQDGMNILKSVVMVFVIVLIHV